MCKRHVNIKCLLCDFSLLNFLAIFERTDVMQSVCHFYQYNANILSHSQKHFAIVFGLRLLLRRELKLFKLRNAVYDLRDFLAKHIAYVVIRIIRIFYNIMQNAGDDRLSVQLQLR